MLRSSPFVMRLSAKSCLFFFSVTCFFFFFHERRNRPVYHRLRLTVAPPLPLPSRLSPCLPPSPPPPHPNSTFLSGERTTIADIALACASAPLLEGGGGGGPGALGARDLAGVPHVLRWYRTVTHHPAFSAAAAGASASARALSGTKGQGKHKQKQQQQKKQKSAAAGAKSAGEPAAATTTTTRALGGAAAGDEPLPVVGESGDLTSSASVVQGARRLEQAPARFRRKRVRVRELLANGPALVGQKAVVKGWLRTARAASKGALLFLVVDDGSCSDTVQVRVHVFVLACFCVSCLWARGCGSVVAYLCWNGGGVVFEGSR